METVFQNHVAYSMAKYGMSMCVLGMAGEFEKIGVNALWPRTAIATMAVKNMIGGEAMMNASRKPESGRGQAILTRDARTTNGNFFIDDEVLQSEGVTDLDAYSVVPGAELMPDFFV